MKWFEGCETMDELKAEYKRLAKRWHPDLEGGNLEFMQQINAEYDRLAKILPKVNAKGERYQPQTREAPEAFRAAVVAVQNIPGILVELCGEWLWITGNTREHKDIFKAAGYKWSSNKSAWYWHEGEYRRSGKKHYTMDEIRAMHRSRAVKYDERETLPA